MRRKGFKNKTENTPVTIAKIKGRKGEEEWQSLP